MDFIVEHIQVIFTAIAYVCISTISVTSFLKSLRSEKRTITEIREANQNIKITREGIVQAFKDAVITKDLKISINNQVKIVLAEELEKFQKLIVKSEERKTKMTYWCLKVLGWTAAAGKLTSEQKAEVEELLAMIADEEQIVDTI